MNFNKDRISTELLLQLLAHPQRRLILHHLRESDDKTMQRDELVKRIDNSTTADGGTTSSFEPVDETYLSIQLRHTHLPKLASEGIIEYDETSGCITYQTHTAVEELLDFVSNRLE